jgi:hypothetical protein
MSDIPQIVCERLRAIVPAEAHPDADVLTSFAEQALSGAEREQVVLHLALCRDCRDVVALSVPPLEAVSPVEAPSEQVPVLPTTRRSSNWFAWPHLRWAGLAAGVVVVGSVLLLHPGKPSVVPDDSVKQTVERKTDTPPTDSMIQPVPSPAPAPLRTLTADKGKPDNSRLLTKQTVHGKDSQLNGLQAETPSTPGTLADNQRADSLGNNRNYGYDTARLPANRTGDAAGMTLATSSASSKTAAEDSQSMQSSSQQVMVVEGAAAEVPSAQGTLTARNEATLPIQKAKPAAKEEAKMKSQAETGAARAQAAPSSPESRFALAPQQRSKQSKDSVVQWSLAQGRLQRSVDGGGTWQTALQLQHPLLSYAVRGTEVWAGGQAGTLFHSVDGGTTWTMVQPSTKARALTADVVGIQIQSPLEIALTAPNNESWTTSDGGKTWTSK